VDARRGVRHPSSISMRAEQLDKLEFRDPRFVTMVTRTMKRICLKRDDKGCNLDPLMGINPYLNPDIQYRAVFESGYLKLDLYNVDNHSYLIRHIYLTLFVPNLNPRKKTILYICIRGYPYYSICLHCIII
jgi:hypothetical protein